MGTHGEVVEAHLLGTVEIGTGRVDTTGKQEEVWVVNIRFYPDGKPPGILIENISREQYDNSLVEA